MAKNNPPSYIWLYSLTLLEVIVNRVILRWRKKKKDVRLLILLNLHWFIGIMSQSNGSHANELQKCSQSQVCQRFAGVVFFLFVCFLLFLLQQEFRNFLSKQFHLESRHVTGFQHCCFLSSFFKKWFLVHVSAPSSFRPVCLHFRGFSPPEWSSGQ